MSIKNSSVLEKAALLDKETSKWEYQPTKFSIARFLYYPLNDLWMPHLEITSNYGTSQTILFYDQIIYKLSQSKYCAYCFSILEKKTFYPYCDTCLQEKGLYFLKCYEKGAGLGRGTCDYEDPECKSQFCANYCRSGFTLYLTIIDDNKIKVGITKSKNIFYKLLEEGVPFGLNFNLPADSIKDAIDLKEAIIRKFGWRNSLFFEDKLQLYMHSFKDTNINLESIVQMVEQEFNLELDQKWNLKDYAFNIPSKIDYIKREPFELIGSLLGFWGSIGFFREFGQVFAFDMKSMTGRILENVIG